jgi:polysaccharide biosynthesis transport protein
MSEQPYKISPPGFGDGVRPVNLDDGASSYTPSLFSRDFVRRLRRNGLRLAVWVVICLVAAIAYVAMARPEFTSSAQLVLEPRLRIPVGADPTASGLAPILDSAQAESQVQILKSERVLRFVFDSLKLENDPAYAPAKSGSGGGLLSFFRSKSAQDEAAQSKADLAREQAFQAFSRNVAVRRVGQSYIIEVTFRALSPSAAARIANAIAASYIRDQVVFRAAPDVRGSEFLQGRISSVQAQKQAATEAVLTGVIPDVQFPDADARIVSSALEPLTKSFPQTRIILLVAVVVALLSGVGLVALSFTFDRKIWSEAQLERATGLECLAGFSIRRIRDDLRRFSTAVTHPDSEFARALKTLWIKLASASSSGGEMAIAFVAVERGDGQTTVGANLAHLLAHNEERATLVDADFQRSTLTRCYAPQSTGSLRDFIHSRTPDQLGEVGLRDDLRFIPAVSTGTSVGTDVFLGSAMVRALLGELTKRGSVIMDVPPLRSSADAIAVGRFLSGVVVVAVSGRTNGDDLAEAVRTLRAANTRVLGAVLIHET